MAATPYVYERQVEYWTSRSIEDFFFNAGFEVLVFPLTQLTERDIPVDYLFVDLSIKKLFGLQYKALYYDSIPFWNLDRVQHQNLATFSWMYYGLSDLTAARHHRNALHYLRVAHPAMPYTARLTCGEIGTPRHFSYMRWAAFYEGLQACMNGAVVRDKEDLTTHLWPNQEREAPREITEIATDVFIVDFARAKIARFAREVSALGPLDVR